MTPTDDPDQVLAQAASNADALATRVRLEGSLDAAFAALEAGIAQVEASGLPIDAVIPGTEEQGLGFALRRARSGRGFWEIYSEALRKSLCEPGGQLNDLAKKGTSATAGGIVTAIVAVLSLPLVVLPILTPVAVIIASIGIDAWCDWSGGASVEPQPG